MDETLAKFSVSKLQCTVESDRKIVEHAVCRSRLEPQARPPAARLHLTPSGPASRQIARWFGSLEDFEVFVRKTLAGKIRRSQRVSARTGVPYHYVCFGVLPHVFLYGNIFAVSRDLTARDATGMWLADLGLGLCTPRCPIQSQD